MFKKGSLSKIFCCPDGGIFYVKKLCRDQFRYFCTIYENLWYFTLHNWICRVWYPLTNRSTLSILHGYLWMIYNPTLKPEIEIVTDIAYCVIASSDFPPLLVSRHRLSSMYFCRSPAYQGHSYWDLIDGSGKDWSDLISEFWRKIREEICSAVLFWLMHPFLAI